MANTAMTNEEAIAQLEVLKAQELIKSQKDTNVKVALDIAIEAVYDKGARVLSRDEIMNAQVLFIEDRYRSSLCGAVVLKANERGVTIRDINDIQNFYAWNLHGWYFRCWNKFPTEGEEKKAKWEG